MSNKGKYGIKEIKDKSIEYVHSTPKEEIKDYIIPQATLNEWQKITDVISSIFDLPVALIKKVEPPFIEVLISSKSEGNPYYVGEKERLVGLFCNTVMITDDKLLIPNTQEDEIWKENPDVELGISSYLGYPITWPNGQMFGTICVLDTKTNYYSKECEETLERFKNILNCYLEIVYINHSFKTEINVRKKLEEELRNKNEELGNLNQMIDKALAERIKELTGIYSVSRYLIETDKQTKQALEDIIEFIPPAWQYPECTVARIRIENVIVTSKDFSESEWKQSVDIIHKEKKIGELEVYYTKERPDEDEGPFLKEEIDLIEGLARLISGYFARVKQLDNLKKSEQRYSLAQKAANIGSWDWNISTNELKWSEQIEPLFGFKRGEFKKSFDAFLECIHPEDKSFVLNSVNMSVESGADYDIEHRIVWPDGTIRWVSEKGDVFRDQNGSPTQMLGIVQDITKSKLAEIKLKESEDHFRKYFELGLIGIARTSVDKEWLEVNDHLCEILGYTREELFQKTWSDLTHPDYLDTEVEFFDNVLSGELDGYKLQKKFIKKDGDVLDIEISVECLRKSNGEVDFFIAVFHDITEEKKAEGKLMESEYKYRQLFNRANDAILIISIEEAKELGRFLAVNTKACDLLGYTEEEMLNLAPMDILSLDDIVKFDETKQQILAGEIIIRENIFFTKNKKGIPVEISAHRIYLEDESVIMVIARDITERKHSEALQKIAFSQIERNIQEFANLVDQIRNPLAVIQGSLEVDITNYKEMILKNIEYIYSITSEISDRWMESEQFVYALKEQFLAKK